VTHHRSAKHEPNPKSPAKPQVDATTAAQSVQPGSTSSEAAADAFAEALSAEGAIPGGISPSPPAEETVSVAIVAQMQAEIASLKDRELRARAELENFRRRAARELDECVRYAGLLVLRDLLPVLDNVERAIQAGQQNADAAGLMEGVKMMGQQLEELLQRHHCKRIEALHAPFDPNFHHAILQQPSEEFPANTVVMVTQNGYQLHDRVVRPSQVIVSTAK